jgi:selenocysteine lyase/cysteine desulfurase
VGAAAAVDFMAMLSQGRKLAGAPDGSARRDALAATFQALKRRGDTLLKRLWQGLGEIDGLTLYGPPPGTPRTPTLAFTLRGHSTDEVAIALARQGVFVSNGDFYAATVVERLGQAAEGLVRAGCSCYTTGEEVERLIQGVRALGS